MNPASYSAMDSLTFLFDFGASAQLSWFDDGVNKQKNKNGNIEYLAMQFPLSRNIAMSIGLIPYSFVGYNFGSRVTDEDTPYQNQYIGTGGLNEIYGGLSIDIWKERLSFGTNVGYFFGTVSHNSNLLLEGNSFPVYKVQDFRVRDVKFDFGLQYSHPVSASERYTLGLVYSPSNRLNTTTYYREVMTQTSGSEVLDSDTTSNLAFDIPNSYGVGVSYTKRDKLTIGVDFLYEDWSTALFYDRKDEFRNRMRVAGGFEFIPGYMNRSFFQRMRYRAGVNYGNSYQQVTSSASGLNKMGYREYGASVGFGLPLIDNRSLLNISFEYTQISPQAKSMIDEKYFRFTLNYTFNELWFYKFKLN